MRSSGGSARWISSSTDTPPMPESNTPTGSAGVAALLNVGGCLRQRRVCGHVVFDPELGAGLLEEGLDFGARGARLIGVELERRHDAFLPFLRIVIEVAGEQHRSARRQADEQQDRKSTRLNSSH